LLSDIDEAQDPLKQSNNHTKKPTRGGNASAPEQDLGEAMGTLVSAMNKGFPG
jgi:hypothetical protein